MTATPSLASSLPLDFKLQDRYQIQTLLTQEGGFSNIYIAWDHQLSKHVIVKEIAPHDLVQHSGELNIELIDPSKAAVLARIIENSEREARVLQDLTQRGVTNISSYIADFYTHETHYIVMEWVQGQSLAAWNQTYLEKNEPFPVDFLEKVLIQTLNILTPIHAAGYYHCDIKPQNLIISDEGKVTLIDFGAVRSQEFQHDDNVAISPGFSPPEFYPSHRAQIGAWTDIYMIAAMVYNLITRKVPESAEIRIVRDRLTRLSAIPGLIDRYPDALLSSVSKALSVTAAERFADTETWLEFYSGMSAGRQLKRAHKMKAAVRKGGTISATDMARSKMRKNPQKRFNAHAAKAIRPRAQEGNDLTIVFIILAILGVGVAIFLLLQQS